VWCILGPFLIVRVGLIQPGLDRLDWIDLRWHYKSDCSRSCVLVQTFCGNAQSAEVSIILNSSSRHRSSSDDHHAAARSSSTAADDDDDDDDDVFRAQSSYAVSDTDAVAGKVCSA